MVEQARQGNELLAAADPPPVSIRKARRPVPLLILCDHADRAAPAGLSGLGLKDKDLDNHIAWDPGAAALAHALAGRFGCAAIFGVYSRLVYDLNRPPSHAGAMAEVSDGVTIPANARLSEEERHVRAAEIYHPYHAEITRRIDDLSRRHTAPAIIAIHTYTPHMNGRYRAWQIGALWNRDSRLAAPFMACLKMRGRTALGDNLPYTGRRYNHTVDRHGLDRGLPHLSIELRNDLPATAAGLRRWTQIIGDALDYALDQAGVARPQKC